MTNYQICDLGNSILTMLREAGVRADSTAPDLKYTTISSETFDLSAILKDALDWADLKLVKRSEEASHKAVLELILRLNWRDHNRMKGIAREALGRVESTYNGRADAL